MDRSRYNYKGGWEAIGRGLSATGGASANCFANFRSVQQLAAAVDKVLIQLHFPVHMTYQLNPDNS